MIFRGKNHFSCRIQQNNVWLFRTLKNNLSYPDKFRINVREDFYCCNCTDMVGLFSENPLVGYCLSTPISQTFNLDFSLPIPIKAHKYVLQSLYNVPNTDCYWTYPVSWKIYYGDDFDNLKLLDSVTDNQILSKR